MQQTIPVQVPISSGNGQTIYQTIHFPVQLATAAVPNIIQAQPIVPQMASILTPNGQLQQVIKLFFLCFILIFLYPF